MKIYISGKIAGDPDYKGKFARAAAQLERLGATVINPATAPEGLDKLDYMRICFARWRRWTTSCFFRTGRNLPVRSWNARGATMSACRRRIGKLFG